MNKILMARRFGALAALVFAPLHANAEEPAPPLPSAAPSASAPVPPAPPAPAAPAPPPPTGRALGAQTSEAEALFQHGVELMKADRCSEAIPEFLKSNGLDKSAATYLNLGTCYARLGRKATAWKSYRDGAAAAQDEQDDALRERALQAMAKLGPGLTKVQIVTAQSSPQLSIRINGEVVSNYDGLPIPLDSGESVIEAAAPGHEPWRRSVTANDLGATIVIQVPDLQPLPPPAPPPYLAPVESARPDLRLPGVLLGGTGIAAVVVGSVFGVSAKQTYDDSGAYCQSNHCTAQGVELRDSARSKATVSTVSIGLGLVAVAAGVVMWVVSPSSSMAPQRAATPWKQARIDIGGFEMQVEAVR